MGSFSITPDGNLYKTEIKYKDKKYSFDLPKALQLGYSMFVNNMASDSLNIKISKSAEIANIPVGLSIACRGRVSFFNILDVSANAVRLKIDKSVLTSGVNNITLFNNNGEVLSERLVFIDNKEQARLKSNEIKDRYQPFEKIDLNFSATDNSGKPVETSLSLSVRDASSSFGAAYADNIQTNLLLGSDLKGYIHNPGYYFSSAGSKRLEALDLLMMTQGWRRYEWRQMVGFDSFEVKHKVEDGLLIKGSVQTWFSKKEKKGVDILCWLLQDGASLKGTVQTDENGDFAFLLDSVDIYGKWQLGLQASEKGKRKFNHILLDRFFTPQARILSVSETFVTDSLIILSDDTLEESSVEKVQVLPEVVVKQRVSSRRPNFTYNVEQDINEDTDKGEYVPASIRDYLNQKDALFASSPTRCMVLTRMTNGRWSSNDFLYKLERASESIEATDATDATEIDVNEVHNIVVVRNIGQFLYNLDKNKSMADIFPSLNSSEANTEDDFGLKDMKFISTEIDQEKDKAGGMPLRNIYLVYRYPNNLGKFKKGIRQTYFEGYSQVAEFYSPDYNANPVIPGDMDYRRTLYWNPDLKTDSAGKTSVSFYNNNVGKQIIVSCEGLTNDGNPIVGEE